jgi:hypothetical protein
MILPTDSSSNLIDDARIFGEVPGYPPSVDFIPVLENILRNLSVAYRMMLLAQCRWGGRCQELQDGMLVSDLGMAIHPLRRVNCFDSADGRFVRIGVPGQPAATPALLPGGI